MSCTNRYAGTSLWLSRNVTLLLLLALEEQGHGDFAKPRDRGLLWS